MLNRRLLRVKVMQALYGLKQAERSDYYLSIDHIADIFAPDLNSMEPQNHEELKKKKENAAALFSQMFTDVKPNLDNEHEKIKYAVVDAVELYHKRLKVDIKRYKSQMLEEVERVHENYLLALRFITDLIDYSELDEEEEKKKYIQKEGIAHSAKNLRKNVLFQKLKDDEEIEKARLKRNLSWDQEFVRRYYKDEVKNNDAYADYLKLASPTFEEDRKVLLTLVKSGIFKNESIQSFFEDRDFNWIENQTIVKGLITKTLKSAEPDTERLMMDISGNWEEDKEFFQDLFTETLNREDELELQIAAKAHNWDMERIALTDNIILKMALTEMITFPSIPVKVTINEYIELSKVYSTPKSKQFVNGMLDSISLEFIEKGIIKKSGRGLIDNK